MPITSHLSAGGGDLQPTVLAADSWGQTAQGGVVNLYTLSNDVLKVTLSDYGARIVSVLAPDRDGRREDVVLGYRTLAEYEADTKQYFGATIGRYANRIANGRFTLQGTVHQVPLNNGPNALHGGPEGFDRRIWKSTIIPGAVEMSLTSEDGDMGFPGQLQVWVRFSLRGHDLLLEYGATTNKTTIINLTNHSYFNLEGESSGTVLSQTIRIFADRYTPVTADLVPTGIQDPVNDSPFDFRKARTIMEGLQTEHPQLQLAGGYDHNFVLEDAPSGDLKLAAQLTDPASGRTLTVSTTEPGVQFYSGNFLDGSIRSKGEGMYERHAGLCLETQHFPDSPNQPHFPSTILTPHRQFRSRTVFTFGIAQDAPSVMS
jgi:aldose 1-epimerase